MQLYLHNDSLQHKFTPVLKKNAHLNFFCIKIARYASAGEPVAPVVFVLETQVVW